MSRRLALIAVAALAVLTACGRASASHPLSANEPSPSVAATDAASPSPSPSPTRGPASPTAGCQNDGWDCTQQQRFAAAASYLAKQPGYLSIVVRDRKTGAVWKGGDTSRLVWAGSTPKLAVAVVLLERHRAHEITLTAADRKNIADMLAFSSNTAADALWAKYGREALTTRMKSTYGMTNLTFVNGFPRTWGFIKYTAQDLANLSSYVLDKLNPEDRAYVVGAMKSVSDNQRWGVWAAGAANQPGNKNGWSIEKDDGTDHPILATTGFAGPDQRYVVAAMYHVPHNGTMDRGTQAESDLIALVFGQPVPAKVSYPPPDD